MALVPCPSCRRHVRGDDASCPFCKSSLPRSLAARAVPSPATRLSRSALVAFATSVAACGGQFDVGDGTGVVDDAGTDGIASDSSGADDTGGNVAAYGAPADTGGPVDDSGAPGPVYGAPVDAGAVDTGVKDTGIKDTGVVDTGLKDTGGALDAGGAPDIGTASDSGVKDGQVEPPRDGGTVELDAGGPLPAYGLPPWNGDAN